MTLTFLAGTSDGATASTYTFTSQSLGAVASDRHIILVASGRKTGAAVTISATIGGVAANQVAIASDERSGGAFWTGTALFILEVPTGTSSDIVITFGGACVRCGIATYRADNLQSATPTATATDTGISPSVSITSPDNGFVVAGAFLQAGGTTWGGVSQDYSETVEGSNTHTAASSTASGSLSITTISTASPGEYSLAVAAWSVAPDLSVNGKEPVAAWCPSLDTAGNGTTTLTDLVGSNNGTLTNMDAATDWVADTDAGGVRALDFDGNSDYVTSSLAGTGTSGSISVWAKFRTLAEGTHAVFFSGAGSYTLINQIGSSCYFYWYTGGTTLTKTSAFTVDTWHHIVMTADGTTVKGYIDGLLVVSGAGTQNWNATSSAIGGWSGQTARTIDGRLDDIRIFNTALDSSDAAALYTRGRGATNVTTPIVAVNSKTPVAAWVPSISRGDWGSTRLTDLVGTNHGTLTNMDAATDWVADTVAGGVRALDFDGSNDRVTTPFAMTSNVQSMSYWVRFNSLSGSQLLGVNEYIKRFYLGINSANIFSGFGDAFHNTTPHGLTVSTWVHIILSGNGTTATVFINGSQILTFGYSLPVVSTSTFTVGGLVTNRTAGFFINGRVDDLRVFNQALDATDVAYLYNSGNGRGRVVEPAPTGVTYHPLSSRSTHPLRFSI